MQIEPIIKEVKKKILKLYGKRLSNMILYGSRARGEATEISDIDLLIVIKGRMNGKKEFEKKQTI